MPGLRKLILIKQPCKKVRLLPRLILDLMLKAILFMQTHTSQWYIYRSVFLRNFQFCSGNVRIFVNPAWQKIADFSLFMKLVYTSTLLIHISTWTLPLYNVLIFKLSSMDIHKVVYVWMSMCAQNLLQGCKCTDRDGIQRGYSDYSPPTSSMHLDPKSLTISFSRGGGRNLATSDPKTLTIFILGRGANLAKGRR